MEEFKGDKRTKAYKEWKAKFELENESKSKGLGDTVEKVFKATGVDKVAKWLFGEDCGCKERKEKLNYLFPYQKPLCLKQSEHKILTNYFVRNSDQIKESEQKELLGIYNRVFKDNRELTSCSSCFLNGVWKKLERIYKEYENE